MQKGPCLCYVLWLITEKADCCKQHMYKCKLDHYTRNYIGMMHCAGKEVNIPLQSQQVLPMLTHAGMTAHLHQMHKLDASRESLTVAPEKETQAEMTWH